MGDLAKFFQCFDAPTQISNISGWDENFPWMFATDDIEVSAQGQSFLCPKGTWMPIDGSWSIAIASSATTYSTAIFTRVTPSIQAFSRKVGGGGGGRG